MSAKHATSKPYTIMDEIRLLTKDDIDVRVAQTSNYDGKVKARTKIGGGVFIGCQTKFIPPVSVGDGAYIAAGTTVTDDVPENSFVIGRSRQIVKTDWQDKRKK